MGRFWERALSQNVPRLRCGYPWIHGETAHSQGLNWGFIVTAQRFFGMDSRSITLRVSPQSAYLRWFFLVHRSCRLYSRHKNLSAIPPCNDLGQFINKKKLATLPINQLSTEHYLSITFLCLMIQPMKLDSWWFDAHIIPDERSTLEPRIFSPLHFSILWDLHNFTRAQLHSFTRTGSWWKLPRSAISINYQHQLSNFIWLVVGPPLWKIWVRQLGWWNSQYIGK